MYKSVLQQIKRLCFTPAKTYVHPSTKTNTKWRKHKGAVVVVLRPYQNRNEKDHVVHFPSRKICIIVLRTRDKACQDFTSLTNCTFVCHRPFACPTNPFESSRRITKAQILCAFGRRSVCGSVAKKVRGRHKPTPSLPVRGKTYMKPFRKQGKNFSLQRRL